jgi:hypothetical protein
MLERVGGVKKVAEHVSGNYELMHSIVREVRCELEAGRKVVELKEFGEVWRSTTGGSWLGRWRWRAGERSIGQRLCG